MANRKSATNPEPEGVTDPTLEPEAASADPSSVEATDGQLTPQGDPDADGPTEGDPTPGSPATPEDDPAKQPGDDPRPGLEVEVRQSVDVERAQAEAGDLVNRQAEADAAAADPTKAPDPDPPVYDDRGNVRPRGTEGAEPMTYPERVDVAERVSAEDAERLEEARNDPEGARIREPEPEPADDAQSDDTGA